MGKGLPWFRFWVDDFLGSTKVGLMDAHDLGCYVMLLLWCSREGGFFLAPDQLARWCHTTPAAFQDAWDRVLSRCFELRDGRYHNTRMDDEVAGGSSRYLAMVEGGRKGGLRSAQARVQGGLEGGLKGGTKQPEPEPEPEETKSKEPAKKPPSPEKLTFDALYEGWIATVGAVDYGRLRKALKPLMHSQSAPSVADMLEAFKVWRGSLEWLAAREKSFETVERFAARAQEFVELGRMPRIVNDVLTRRGHIMAGPPFAGAKL